MPIDTIGDILDAVSGASNALSAAEDKKNRRGTWFGMRWWGWLLLILIFIPIMIILVGAALFLLFTG